MEEMTNSPDNEDVELNLDQLKEFIKQMETEKQDLLDSITFSGDSDCELKKLHYDAFEKRIMKVKSNNLSAYLSGVRIIEGRLVPKNMMLWHFKSGKTQIFVYKNGQIYKTKKIKSGGNNEK